MGVWVSGREATSGDLTLTVGQRLTTIRAAFSFRIPGLGALVP